MLFCLTNSCRDFLVRGRYVWSLQLNFMLFVFHQMLFFDEELEHLLVNDTYVLALQFNFILFDFF